MKKIFTLIVILFTMLALAGCGGSNKDTKKAATPEQMDKNGIKIIQEAMECSEETAKKHYEALKAVEFVPVEKINFMSNEFNDTYYNPNKPNSMKELLNIYLIKGGSEGDYGRLTVYEDKGVQKILTISCCNGGSLYIDAGGFYESKPTIRAKISEARVNNIEKYVTAAQSAVKKAIDARAVKFRPYQNGVYNGRYYVKKSKTEKDAKAPFIVSGNCEILNEVDGFIYANYLVNMDESCNVKHIRVVQNYKEKTFNGIKFGKRVILDKDFN